MSDQRAHFSRMFDHIKLHQAYCNAAPPNMKVNYPLCGGYHDNCYVPKCATGNHNCNYCVSMKKNYDIGWTKQNTVLVCCSVAQTANENNLRTDEEVKKYLNSSPSPSTSP